MFRSTGIEQATEMARSIALSKRHGYRSAADSFVSWQLQKVEEVRSLFDAEIAEGTEVYWKFFESSK